MNFSPAWSLKTSLFAAAIGLISFATSAAETQSASPFGLQIGVATCDDARVKLGRVQESKLGGTDVLLTANDPSGLYEGATKLIVRCSDNRISAVQFEAPKGGMGNGAARDVYAGLARKYKRVKGGPMPSLGNGYARFVTGNSVIEQSAPHLSFEFTVTYYEKSFYDNIVASNKAEAKKSHDSKQSSL